MNIYQYPVKVAMILITTLTPITCTTAQEIPNGVTDRHKLDTILHNAKSHLLTHENDVEWLKTAGIASHQLASMKVAGASDNAVGYLKKATELEPDNAEMLAYLGSAYAMAGRDSSFVVNKVSNVNKGLAALDKAVKKDPSNLTVRFIRGSVSYNLPAMFSRKTTAENDYLFFTNEAESGAQVDPNRLAEAYYKLGKIAEEQKRKSAAETFYTQAKKASPQSDWAQQADKAMK
ncbi:MULTISPECIES: tetratricopeptide repeat protein [unclassified Herbaspirillum]|uniref:tetratricopeptide repeat protein n=1 Tax=unclassified Herbaspirillum TaxID=2624150 RepID=UPI001151BCF4|nr:MULTISPECIES: tetratricopeptide repeat protein [unclassified Herbaspirillum]MBB5393829.1 tetratricopeptide (TPR) repeat protein [Herbaspirillum sp. SJZ102]TQK01314.1 tetratricopeptide repeat protein [Herbaspirillum sp. SJZ130]TQK05710.1 tetratricopeptide repeat protein [Herbaspirillum sp. SJZ106]